MSSFRQQSTADSATDPIILDLTPGQHWEPEVRKPWLAVNICMAVLLVLTGVFTLYVALTVRGAFFLLLLLIAANVILGKLSRKARETGKGRTCLHILRTVILCGMALYFAPLVLVNGFADVPQLYAVKRYLAGQPEMLPQSLPTVCEDYRFLTESTNLSPDFHRSTYLSFYTDTATLDAYAAGFGGTRTETPRLEELTEEELKTAYYYEFPNCPAALPYWVIFRVHPEEDLHGAVIYELGSDSRWFSGPGMLLDYDSGYVLFWT